MSYKPFQLSPQASTRGTRMRIAVQGPWSAPSGNPGDMQFLRSWLEYASELDGDGVARGRVNWGALLGLTLAVGVSGGFWTGIGLLIARLVG